MPYRLKNNSECGHTLVELLIAMALALFMMTGLVQVFSSSSKTFASVSDQVLMQENGRFALSFIERQLRRAGFIEHVSVSKYSDQYQRENLIFPRLENFDASEVAFQAGAVVTGLDDVSIDNVKEGSDIIHIRYQRSERVIFRDCINTRLDDRYKDVVISFFISEDNKLRCRGVWSVRGSRELIEGIEDMQVLYGVDSDGDMPVRVDKYVNAGELSADEWLKVVAVKITILADAGGAGRRLAVGEEHEYQLFEETRSFTDGKIRAVFFQTIEFRNRSF